MTTQLLGLILYYSGIYHLNPAMVAAVIEHESNYNQYAHGEKDERGYMQLMPSSFPSYNPDDLYKPEVNIREGTRYLAEIKKKCSDFPDDSWIICFNLGPNKAKTVKYPKLFPYYKKVKQVENKLKDGDKVVVEGLYNFITDGYGIYRRESLEPHYKGFLIIENEYGAMMRIEPKRVKKAQE